MEVKRITHNNSPHITTDYMYEGDNIGINLDSLNKAKTKKTIEKHTPEVKRMFKSLGDYLKR